MARPYVVLNVAATVDGKIDTRDRRGAAISSDIDRQRVDELRASVDAVMIGGRTLYGEDPRLTVKSAALRAARMARGEPENPAKVAIASRLNLASDSRFLTTGPARIIVFVPRGAAAQGSGESVEVYAFGEERVDLAAAMEKLSALGMRRVLAEGGGSLNFELLRRHLVDELQVFVAPRLFGGASAPTLADGAGNLDVKLTRVDVEVFDEGGVLLRYMVERS